MERQFANAMDQPKIAGARRDVENAGRAVDLTTLRYGQEEAGHTMVSNHC